ncbi:MAG TPA: excinuclease ABC subunit C [Candidatus Marinimicrobia bacterium]|nr:excinuclease ABC subunit C [Candidatus Neomarinimicrobiota bacterium]
MTRYPESLIEKIKHAPVDPGCYLYKNKQGKIIYVGKAKNLANRVKSYFVNPHSKDPKTQSLVKRIADVEFIVTLSEIEALILENTLIKQHRPRYNVFLRDDKTFPYIRITNEPYPRAFITRRLINDGSKYYGPYTDARAIRDTLRIIKKAFTVRTCKFRLDNETVQAKKVKLCLQYHIHNCEGPCQKLISKEEYDTMISKLEAFLKGDLSEVVNYLQRKMESASEKLLFELAARYRDNINLLQHYAKRQSVEFMDFKDRDFINIFLEGDTCVGVVIRVRHGKMLGKDTIFLEGISDVEQTEIMRNFIQQYYNQSQLVPEEINVNIYPSEQDILQKWLANNRHGSVKITRPAREEKLRLMRLAEKNARIHLQEYLIKKSQAENYIPKTLQQLQTDLSLTQLPKRIEAFDISNIQGKYAVASLVTFYNARPQKSEYRRFKIKTVKGIDDFAMMAEVVRRRYSRQIKEQKELPDLILIDGGKGQLSAVREILKSLNLDKIALAGLAKKLDEIFLPDQNIPLSLSRDSIALLLLQRIRDEAHRFAITYHRNLRGHGEIDSILNHIPGLGSKKRQVLWSSFGTISKMRSASIEDLSRINGIGPKLADIIWNYLHHS